MSERPIALPPLGHWEVCMRVIHFHYDCAFDAEATEAMGRAFESICQLKPNVSRELIATRIIQMARAGERDAVELAARMLHELRPRRTSLSERLRSVRQPTQERVRLLPIV